MAFPVTRYAVFSAKTESDRPESVSHEIPIPGEARFAYEGEQVVMTDATWEDILLFFDKVIAKKVVEYNLTEWHRVYLEGIELDLPGGADDIPTYNIEAGS